MVFSEVFELRVLQSHSGLGCFFNMFPRVAPVAIDIHPLGMFWKNIYFTFSVQEFAF